MVRTLYRRFVLSSDLREGEGGGKGSFKICRRANSRKIIIEPKPKYNTASKIADGRRDLSSRGDLADSVSRNELRIVEFAANFLSLS